MFQYRLTGQLDLSCSRHDVSVVCLMSVRCASLLGKAANCLIVFSPCSCHSTLLSCHSNDRREEESRNLKDKGEILRFAQNDNIEAKKNLSIEDIRARFFASQINKLTDRQELQKRQFCRLGETTDRFTQRQSRWFSGHGHQNDRGWARDNGGWT